MLIGVISKVFISFWVILRTQLYNKCNLHSTLYMNSYSSNLRALAREYAFDKYICGQEFWIIIKDFLNTVRRSEGLKDLDL